MTNEKKLKNIDWLRKLQEDGQRVPILESEVKLFPDLNWIWEAYDLLSEKRVHNESGPQPIPMSEILSYADYVGITGSIRRDDFLRLVSVMDRVTLKHRYDVINSERQKQLQKAKQRPKK